RSPLPPRVTGCRRKDAAAPVETSAPDNIGRGPRGGRAGAAAGPLRAVARTGGGADRSAGTRGTGTAAAARSPARAGTGGQDRGGAGGPGTGARKAAGRAAPERG